MQIKMFILKWLYSIKMETKYQFYLKRNKYQILFKNINSIYRSGHLMLPDVVNRPAINSSSPSPRFL
jgi:hypothetical protein